MNQENISGYLWKSAALTPSHEYLMPAVLRELSCLPVSKIFDLGCGNGSVANVLSNHGWDVTGVDPSSQGIAQANQFFPELRICKGTAYDDLEKIYGKYPVLLSLEVVEHVYAPRLYAQTIFKLLECGGTAIISTPYHGYFKNLVMSLFGKMDAHFTALWDHGHIKFWSIKTMTQLLKEAGFVELRFIRVGRFPPIAKSMIVIARKP